MTRAIENLIDKKNDFYAFATLPIPELIEQARKFEDRMRGMTVSIYPAAECILGYFESSIFEKKRDEQEEALLDALEQHKDDQLDALGFHAREIHDALTGTKVAERSLYGTAWTSLEECPWRKSKQAS